MSGVLRWEDPPTPDRRGTKSRPALADWALVFAQLRDRPGAWALVTENAQSAAAIQIREGRLRGSGPGGAFDAKCVRVDGALRLYARYVGGES